VLTGEAGSRADLQSGSGELRARGSERAEPGSDGLTDGFGGVFLEIVNAWHADFLLTRPGTAEVHGGALAEDRTWLAFDE
jgi:hypothetical protein